MVIKYNFKGLMAPVFTPFQANARQDVFTDYIPTYGDFLKEKGVLGILVNGTTGEGVSMSTKERKLITEAWVETVNKTNQTLMVQVGGSSLTDVKDMAHHAEKLGVSSILCLPDLFFNPKTVDDLIHYLKFVSHAAPNTPLFYYHIPSFTGVNLSMSEFLSKGKDQIPTLSGIKFTSNDLDEGAKCLKVHEDLTVFLGADTIFSAAVMLGFDSGIMTTLNFWPERFQEIQNNINNGNVKQAMLTQAKISKDIENILASGSWVHQMKLYMKNQLQQPVGLTRPPLGN